MVALSSRCMGKKRGLQDERRRQRARQKEERRKRRATQRKRRTERYEMEREAEVLPGLWAKQEGRRIRLENRQTKEQWLEWRRKLKEWSSQLEIEIPEQVAALQERLRDLPALQLLAQLAAVVIFHDPETYKEPEMAHPLITVEYPTWLALLEPTPTLPSRVHVIDGPQLDEILTRIQKLVSQVTWYFISHGLPETEEESSAVQQLQLHTRLYEISVRDPGYYHHFSQVLRGLFAPFDKDIHDLVGFTVEEAIDLTNTIGEMVSDVLDAHRDKVKSAETELFEKVTAYSSTGVVPEGVPDSLLEHMKRLSPSERNTTARNLAIGCTRPVD